MWVPSWTASPGPAAAPVSEVSDQTFREIVHLSAGGKSLRVRLSNAYGTQPLHIDQAAVAARASGAAIQPRSGAALTFSGSADVVIPPGAYVISDPLTMDAPAHGDLAISLHVPGPAPLASIHLTQRNAAYQVAGNQVTAETLPAADAGDHPWAWVSEVEVAGGAAKQAVVAFGDSITDGANIARDSNDNWPDVLARRLDAAHIPLAVVNAGLTGDRLLHDGQWAPFGVAGLARFDRDVLAQPNIRSVIVLLGINDIGQVLADSPEHVTAAEIERGLTQLAARAHEKGLKIFAATLTPFKVTTIKDYYSDEKEAERQAVNAWIRSNHDFDGVIDFEKAIEDPANPGHMLPAYDSGDHLHPGAEGEKAMAAAIPLNLLR
ncbi:MAG: SGNH/GDSL hydrolase family protein [Asticcacaulis sp.]